MRRQTQTADGPSVLLHAALSEEELERAALPQLAAGSGASNALEANKNLHITRLDKIVKRAPRKTLKNATSDDYDDGASQVPGKLITRENDQYITSIGMMLGECVQFCERSLHLFIFFIS